MANVKNLLFKWRLWKILLEWMLEKHRRNRVEKKRRMKTTWGVCGEMSMNVIQRKCSSYEDVTKCALQHFRSNLPNSSSFFFLVNSIGFCVKCRINRIYAYRRLNLQNRHGALIVEHNPKASVTFQSTDFTTVRLQMEQRDNKSVSSKICKISFVLVVSRFKWNRIPFVLELHSIDSWLCAWNCANVKVHVLSFTSKRIQNHQQYRSWRRNTHWHWPDLSHSILISFAVRIHEHDIQRERREKLKKKHIPFIS